MDKMLSKKKIIFALIVIAILGFIGYKRFSVGNKKPQYQTSMAQKGTLIRSVSASGNVTSGSSVSITTQASGVVKDVFVKNGDSVTQGQAIADLTLDQASQQKQASAYSSYLSAKASLDKANADFNTLQNTEFTANQKLINDAVARGLATNDPTYIEENASWLAAEAAYKNQQGVITQAQAALSSSALALNESSSTIYAPISGTVNGLDIASGSPISALSSTTNNPSQSIGSITQSGPIQAQVSLSETDSTSVSVGQKATLTLDAFSGKTFTGKVVSINTNGVVSSGVTTYPTTISLDTKDDHIYPNMAVNANIITKVEDNVLLVDNGAVQTQNGQSTVRILKSGQLQSVPVEIGDSNDTQTVISSGLSEGDVVVTGVITTQSSGGTSSSPFGATRGFGGGIFRGGGGGGRGG